MSTQPCEHHGSPGRGALRRIYPTLYREGQRYGGKRRVCADCLHELLAVHRQDWLPKLGYGFDTPEPGCQSCRQAGPVDDDLLWFFITVYSGKDQKSEFFSRYCRQCATHVEKELELHAQ